MSEQLILYVPSVGDAISATRKIHSEIYENRIIGPVVDCWDNACRVVTNAGQSNEGDYRLYFNDWNFMFLHKIPAYTEVNK